MSGEYAIAAPRQLVWDALNDPEALRQCIPGCETIERQSDDELTATVTAKVGPVKAKFQGVVRLSDLDPPKSYRISGEGKGGAAGFAKGGATVELVETEGGQATLLRYAVDANVGGKLAQIGARLIDSTAKKLAGEFFETFASVVVARAGAAGAASPAPDDHPQEAPHESAETIAKTEETMSTTPEGIPEENVYSGTHWMVYLTLAGSLAGLAALLVTSWAW
ncbi:MAG: SRPBCC family protein [Thalassobaculaceae bacterium]